jgi:type II secretory pathway pseudopilin PulG
MFCFKCGGSMPDDSTVCPQCAAPVVNKPAGSAPQPAPPAASPGSAWLNPSPGQPQQYAAQPQASPGQGRTYPVEPQQTDGKAVASLVLGILSIVMCFSFLTGIPAVILGHISKSNIRNSMGRLKGDGMATAGLIMGYISFTVMIPMILIIAAIAIPNLLRSRMAANESRAASTVRSVNTAQAVYSTNNPAKGYAEDLATLGPGPTGVCAGEGSADHGCQLDNVLGNARCTVGAWCTKLEYRYSMSATCEGEGACKEYVIVATPIAPTTGTKSFCSTSDAVVRFKAGPPLTAPITADECQSWSAIM